MTAEVAVMNKAGLALAADSMMSYSIAGNDGFRPGSQKIFALSDEHPVAVMIHNAADFLGEPWGECVIPAFKEANGSRGHPTIAAWTGRFLDFVKDYRAPSKEWGRACLTRYVSTLADEVEHEGRTMVRTVSLPGLDFQRVVPALMDLLTEREKASKQVLQNDQVRAVLKEGADAIRTVCASRSWMADDASARRKFMNLLNARLSGSRPSAHHSGIVIAGYGSAQTSPELHALEIEGHLGPVLKMYTSMRKDMSRETEGQIAAFAQRDMVDAFMLGLDQDCFKVILRLVREVASSTLAAIDGAIEDPGFERLVEKATTRFQMKLDHHRARSYNDHVMRLVTMMRPGELPELARSLVYISVMRHTYSIAMPSVGGPIDVALITKANPRVDLRLGRRLEETAAAA